MTKEELKELSAKRAAAYNAHYTAGKAYDVAKDEYAVACANLDAANAEYDEATKQYDDERAEKRETLKKYRDSMVDPFNKAGSLTTLRQAVNCYGFTVEALTEAWEAAEYKGAKMGDVLYWVREYVDQLKAAAREAEAEAVRALEMVEIVADLID